MLLLQDTYDEELLAAVAELLPIIANALGPQTYGPVFQQLVFQPLLKRFQAGQPDGVRSTMIGLLLSSACFACLPACWSCLRVLAEAVALLPCKGIRIPIF